jgi:hypothetical protein
MPDPKRTQTQDQDNPADQEQGGKNFGANPGQPSGGKDGQPAKGTATPQTNKGNRGQQEEPESGDKR